MFNQTATAAAAQAAQRGGNGGEPDERFVMQPAILSSNSSKTFNMQA